MNRLSKSRCGWAVLALAGAAVLAAAGCAPTMQAQRPVTILLMEYQGGTADAQAETLRQQIAGLGLPDVFIVSGAGQASVCVGRFSSWDDKKAHDTLAYVHQIRDSDGQYPFALTLLTFVPEPLPENPWPLEKADGYYTLQVAVWEAPGRGPKAQAYAAELRAQGYEAYVYHGPQLSIVTIGALGPKIFDHPELVGHVDPPNYKGTPTPKPRIIDPAVLALMRKFPEERMDGVLPPPEAHLPCPLVAIPGREAPFGSDTPIPEAIYRITLQLVDTKTGAGRRPAPGPRRGLVHAARRRSCLPCSSSRCWPLCPATRRSASAWRASWRWTPTPPSRRQTPRPSRRPSRSSRPPAATLPSSARTRRSG